MEQELNNEVQQDDNAADFDQQFGQLQQWIQE
jgi:hypothetical protein